MRCHSCDGWVDKRMTDCPICGWRVDVTEVEPISTLPKLLTSSPKSRRKKMVLPPVYAEKPVTLVKEVHRRVTIGITTTPVTCPYRLIDQVHRSTGSQP